MQGTERPIYYFEEAGFWEYLGCVEIVCKRMQKGDIESVVVASSSGEPALSLPKDGP